MKGANNVSKSSLVDRRAAGAVLDMNVPGCPITQAANTFDAESDQNSARKTSICSTVDDFRRDCRARSFSVYMPPIMSIKKKKGTTTRIYISGCLNFLITM